MGLLYDTETRLEQPIPAQLQQTLQQALDDYRPLCASCNLAMRRHHHYARTITARYGAMPPVICRRSPLRSAGR